MTEAERPHLPPIQRWDDDAVWDAYLARPLAEREAITAKVEAALQQHGILAGREMMVALGMPVPPAELWEPVEKLEAERAASAGDSADQVAAMADMLDVSEAEAADILADKPAGRVDH